MTKDCDTSDDSSDGETTGFWLLQSLCEKVHVSTLAVSVT